MEIIDWLCSYTDRHTFLGNFSTKKRDKNLGTQKNCPSAPINTPNSPPHCICHIPLLTLFLLFSYYLAEGHHQQNNKPDLQTTLSTVAMQDAHHQQQAALSPNRPNNRSSASGSGSKTSNETARVRWKPTAQQITILEHIFNSGTVNPPKDVTTNIRKQLEQFGPVEDVNIFYWFQNRRSRWSRRLRQMRSDSAGAVDPVSSNANNLINFTPPIFNFEPSPQSSFYPDYNANIHIHDSSSSTNHNYEQNSGVSSSLSMFPDATNPPYMPNHPAGSIRVFINGKATKLPTRPVDMRGMFGQDLILVHPTGVPVNEFGFDLQHGESYFLVPRPT